MSNRSRGPTDMTKIIPQAIALWYTIDVQKKIWTLTVVFLCILAQQIQNLFLKNYNLTLLN